MQKLTLALITISFVMAGGNCAADSPLADGQFQCWGEYGGGYFLQVELDGNIAYCMPYRDGIHIFDVSDPTKPKLIGHARDLAGSNAFVLRGGYAYCASYNGLQVFDLSDPSNPKLAGQTAGRAGFRIAVWGDFAFVGEDSQPVFWIYDISTPSQPVQIGSFRIQPATYGFTVMRAADSRLYVTTTEHGLFVLDISNVMEINLLGRWEQRNIQDLAVSGNRAIALLWNDWVVLDVSTPVVITPLLSTHSDARLNRIDLSGQNAWISRSSGIVMMDVSDWLNPVEKWHCDIPTGPLAAEGGLVVFMTEPNLCLARYDPEYYSEEIVGWYPAPQLSSFMLCVDGDLVFLASDYSLVYIFQCATPDNPRWASTLRLPTQQGLEHLAASSGYMLMATLNGGLRIVDVSNPSQPTEVGSCQLPGGVGGVCCQWPFAYTWNYDGLYIVDISNPVLPRYVGSCDLYDEEVRHVVVEGVFAYVATKKGLSIVNIANPSFPVRVGFLDLPAECYRVAASDGRIALLTMGYSGLQICDVLDKRDPLPIGNMDLGAFAVDVGIHGEIAYVSASLRGVVAINIQNPLNPLILGAMETPNMAEDLEVVENTLYLDLYQSCAHFQILHHMIVGDLNGDGYRRLSDLVILDGYLSGLYPTGSQPFLEPPQAGDSNLDGSLAPADLRLFKDRLAENTP